MFAPLQRGKAAAGPGADDAEDIDEDESGWETASDEGDAAAARDRHDASSSQVCQNYSGALLLHPGLSFCLHCHLCRLSSARKPQVDFCSRASIDGTSGRHCVVMCGLHSAL